MGPLDGTAVTRRRRRGRPHVWSGLGVFALAALTWALTTDELLARMLAASAVATLMGGEALYGLRAGAVRMRRRWLFRERSPLAFWCLIVFHAAAGTLFAAYAAHLALERLLSPVATVSQAVLG